MKRTFVFYFIFLLVMPLLSYSQDLSDTLTLDEVVITGMRVGVARRNLPSNVSLIPRERIDEIEESAILPLISRIVPGVFVNERGVTGFGRTGSTSAGNISIRGVGGSPNAQVLVLVDGHPQYMGIFGHPLPNNYVASDLERVEIIRGPASILYGSNAMGGVVNLITRKQKAEGVSGSMRFGYGSFNTSKLMANAGVRNGKFDFFVSYNHDETKGHRENMDFWIDNGYIKSGYKLSNHFKLNADFNIANMTSLDPGREMDMVDVFKASMIRGKTSISLVNNYEKMDGGLLAYYNFGEHDFSDGWMSNDENYGISFYEGLRPFKSSLITFGFDHKIYGGKGSIAFPPAFANQWLTVNESGGYLILQQSMFANSVIINGGMRYENNSMFGGEWVPQAGLIYHLNDQFSVKSSASKGFRSPTIMELYLFAPNQELLPERSNNLDLTFSYRIPEKGFSAELTIFMVNGDNIIQALPNPTPPPPLKRINSGSFAHKGFEWEANYRSDLGFSADFSYSFLSMDNPKLSAPEHMVFTGLNYAYGNFRFALQGNYIGGLYLMTSGMEGLSDDIKESYILLNASVKYNVKENIELFLSGKNLLDQKYSIDYGYTMPGINMMTGLGIRF